MPEETQGYPKDEEGRLRYWKRQISHARAFYKPYFDIGDQLLKIFNNMAANFREQDIDSTLPDNISPIKAPIIFSFF